MEATDYCDKVYKQMVGMKAGLYDLTCQVNKLSGGMKDKAAATLEKLHGMVAGVDQNLEDLITASPTDWSPDKKKIDAGMEALSQALQGMADQMDVAIPDTSDWI
ncbi:MAG: hypothetical protein KKA60_07590 [Proteobacteria bacterium]|nr:hypothetical protein [Pseudomonadota bacterium]